jgi:hypothetical protein
MNRKTFWKEQVMYVVAGKKPPEPLKQAKLTLTRFSTTRPDPDGLTSSFKHIIDGLVLSGILEDDDHDHIGFPTYLWEKVPPKQGKIKIIVEGIWHRES